MRSAIEIMRRRAAAAARALVAAAPPGSVRAVFAGGSVGRDEVRATAVEGALVVHSDVDLYVVVDDQADETEVREAIARAADALPRAQDGAVFDRGIDVGVYRLDDLLAQPVRPGTVDLAQNHVWLHGDRSLVAALQRAFGRPMAKEEALYLLENRAWDAMEAAATTDREGWGAAARTRARLAKVVSDVAAAHLIAEGRFAPTRAARLARLRERRPASLPPRVLAAVESADGAGPNAVLLDDPHGAPATVAEAWCTLAPAVLAVREREPARLLAVRCARGRVLPNYREFVRVQRRAGVAPTHAIAAGWRCASLSPRAALRTHALARALAAREDASSLAFHTGYVEGLTSRMGFRAGTLDQRARAALQSLSS